MANAIRSVVATSASTSTTATFTQPTPLDNTHGLVAMVRQFNATPPTTPVGWTLLPGSGVQGTLWTGIYAKRGDNTTNQIIVEGPSAGRAIILTAFANISEDVFWETPTSAGTNNSTSLAAGNVTTTIAGSQAVGFVAVSSSAGGAGFEWTGALNQRTGSSGTSSTSWAEVELEDAGVNVTTSALWTTANAARIHLVVLRTGEPIVPVEVYPKVWTGTGIADGTSVTTATTAPGESAFSAISGAPVLRVTGGVREIEIPNTTTATTMQWNNMDLPAWQAQFYFRLTSSSATAAGIPIFEARTASGLLFRLTLTTADNISFLNSSNGFVANSAAITKGTERYCISMWGQGGTISVRIYTSTGTLFWSRTETVTNTENLQRAIFGRNGATAYGPAYFSKLQVGDTASEIPGEFGAPPVIDFPKRWYGENVTAGTTLTTSTTGTGDAAFASISGSPIVRVNNAIREIEIPNSTVATSFRWSGLNLATWQARFYFRLTNASATASGIPIFEVRSASGLLFRLTLGTNDTISFLNSSVGFIGASPALSKGATRYRVSVWGQAGTDMVNVRMYNDLDELVWSRSNAVGSSLNVAQFIFGRNGSTAFGPAYYSGILVSNTAAEPSALPSSGIFGYVLESDLTTLTPVSLAGVLESDLTTITPVSAAFSTYEDTSSAPRVYHKQPFTSTSIWNIPLHSGVTYTSTSDPRTSQMRSLTGNVNYGTDWNLAIWYATESSPLTEIKAPRFSYPTWPTEGARYRIPANGVIPGPSTANNGDRWVTIISPDGRSAVDLFKPDWITPGVSIQAAFAYEYPLDSAGGTDPTAGYPAGDGLKAANWPYPGGIIRTWELNSNAAPAERFKHALVASLPDAALKNGYVWPSRSQDGNGATAYSGNIPMGTCFSLPPSFNIEASSLTAMGKALAYAVQNYGVWIGDRAGNGTVTIYTENNLGAAKGQPIKDAWQALVPHLVAVDGRTPSNPGGTGSPRVPLSPEGVFEE